MPDTRLATRISEETFKRLKVASAYYGRTMQELVEDAIQDFLTVLDASKDEDAESA